MGEIIDGVKGKLKRATGCPSAAPHVPLSPCRPPNPPGSVALLG